jgi:hypothetical protein
MLSNMHNIIVLTECTSIRSENTHALSADEMYAVFSPVKTELILGFRIISSNGGFE